MYAFISGASRGIGAGIAVKMAQAGYNLVLTCQKNSKRLDALSDSLTEKYGTHVLNYTLDMADYDAVQEMAADAVKKSGGIDIVINNAGISYIGLITDMTIDEWNRMIAVNLTSLFNTTKAFVPDMIHRKNGQIINISSMWGSVGASCEAAYSAAKGGVNSYTRALAKELAPSGIRVNALACGVIDTDMNAAFSEEERRALEDEIPVGRYGTPEEVGQAVLGLLKMDYVTGQILGVDGAFL